MLSVVARKAIRIAVQNLRPPSPRPTVLVDDSARRATELTRPGPLGRERIVSCLPLDPGPALLVPAVAIQDSSGVYLSDAEQALLGRAPVWVSRMLEARTVEDTRRLG